MCFNANISLSTFILGLTAIIIGLINNVIPWNFSLFYFSVIFMQFLEYLAWIFINNKKINNIVGFFILLLLLIQFFTACYLIYDIKFFFNFYISLIFIFYILLIIYINIKKKKTN